VRTNIQATNAAVSGLSGRPLRLLHVVPSYLPGHRYGGPIASVHGLARALVGRGHRVEVWTTDQDDGERLPVGEGEIRCLDGVQVRYFKVQGPARLRYAPGLRRALEREIQGFDWLHAHGLFQFPSHWALSAARRVGLPAALSPRGMLQQEVLSERGRWRKAAWLRWLERGNLAGLSGLHLTSEVERVTLPFLGHVWPTPWMIPNGIETTQEEAPGLDELDSGLLARLQSGEPLLLFLGRLSWKKGLDRLAEFLPHWPRGHLLVAGPDDGYRAQFEQQLRRAGLADRVTLLGPVRGRAKAALLAHADLLVLPSRSENFANVVVEALARGLPALVTPEVGAAELLTRWQAGWVWPAHTWPERLPRLLEDRSELRRRGQTGRQRVFDELTWPQLAERFEAAYRESSATVSATDSARRASAGGAASSARENLPIPASQQVACRLL
jgi:glycosyltransferase involved in cell wall biosynthesis